MDNDDNIVEMKRLHKEWNDAGEAIHDFMQTMPKWSEMSNEEREHLKKLCKDFNVAGEKKDEFGNNSKLVSNNDLNNDYEES